MEKNKQVKPVKAEIAYNLTYQFYKKVNKESFYCSMAETIKGHLGDQFMVNIK